MTGPKDSEAPQVDIIMATCRHLPYLRPALRSLAGQDWAGWELTVVLDGMADKDARLVVTTVREVIPAARVRRQRRLGVSAARNLGLSLARAELVVFADDDDIWALDKISSQVRLLAEHPDWVGCLHASELVDADGRPSGQYIGGPLDRDTLFGAYSDGWCGAAFMVRRQAAIACGGYSPNYTLCEDLAFAMELVERGHVGWDPRPLIQYRKHRAGMTADERKMFKATLRVYQDRLARAEALGDQDDAETLRYSAESISSWLAQLPPGQAPGTARNTQQT